MKIMNIIHDSVVDGEGLRTVIFFAGCPHACLGCHNPSSWKMNNGQEMSIDEALQEIISNPLTDVTFSGGEPFIQAKEASILAKKLKEYGKNIWIYSGFTYEEIMNATDGYKRKLLSYCDVLVDGRFILEERDLHLSFRGSRNQRIIELT
ncbi:anaerobic ribonucleoside-triphosphate reductase activating protein [Pseudogracilibacillus auburnensis]|uniref:anaerobic ribonucleoside-triphosphate reductase activating protein n=1 Tax=Pseudogracilibacillus auburnensis TaxID=1494959 RepID=UPI001A97A421|nr:anaerobic ribonucleoside-triphosphate reductase activating protein [Pseudogracilibacillus auburnensis]MBO1005715.1 anaerobic ribonucleoside-triphosphate reductase activating protein [Pseudogracilibacillus auburnensis]